MLTVIFRIGGIAVTTELVGQLLKHSGRAAEANVVSIVGFLAVVGLLVLEIINFFHTVEVFAPYIG